MKYLFAFSFFFLLSISSLYSQDDAIRVETDLVTLNVSVTRQGKGVPGLSEADFAVFDNGQKQKIAAFSTADSPVSYGIVYDLHPTTDERTANVLTALRQFTRSIRPADDFFVTVFNETGSLTTDFVPTSEQIDQQIDTGVNSLYDAIITACNRISRSRNHKRVLLVLTDGADHNSLHSFKELKRGLRTLNMPVYDVFFGQDERRQFGYADIFSGNRYRTLRDEETGGSGRAAITDISKTTGGASFDSVAPNSYLLTAVFSSVAAEIQNQYMLSFYPQITDGTWHKLKIVAGNGKPYRLKVSTRKGYRSPKR
jgi:VWFA-related protein